MEDVLERTRREAPWLLEPELDVCAVGSTALAEALRRDGVDAPRPADLDLAWNRTTAQGDALLAEHGVAIRTTTANRERGTLALSLGGATRVEITSFRGADIADDLARRDMTVGAIAWRLHDDTIHDPFGGVADWLNQRVRAVGDAAERVREHPIRWIRYYRKAHGWGFDIDAAIRKLSLPPAETLAPIPAEAVASEFRSALLSHDSPGRFFLELFEVGILQHLAPELASQFDGRPAGPQRHHPEIGQALHLVLALEWAVARSRELPPSDAFAVRFATLCHDLGKGLTDPSDYPSHRGHEGTGRRAIESLCTRLPSFADTAAKRLADTVCELHLLARSFDDLRPGTLARLYEDHFRGDDARLDLFALAVAADSAGRLGREAEGEAVRARVLEDLEWLRERCGSVDAAALRARFPDDVTAFRRALHEARADRLRR